MILTIKQIKVYILFRNKINILDVSLSFHIYKQLFIFIDLIIIIFFTEKFFTFIFKIYQQNFQTTSQFKNF